MVNHHLHLRLPLTCFLILNVMNTPVRHLEENFFLRRQAWLRL